MKPKRSSPEKMHRAAELRKNPTPAEAKLMGILAEKPIEWSIFSQAACHRSLYH